MSGAARVDPEAALAQNANPSLRTVAQAALAQQRMKQGLNRLKGPGRTKVYSANTYKAYVHIGGATGLYSGDFNRKSDP